MNDGVTCNVLIGFSENIHCYCGRVGGHDGKHSPFPECPIERELIQARKKLNELLEKAKNHVMTPEEKEAQRQSWARGEMELTEYERGVTRHLPSK